jgi:RNA polymerase sigma-70 factor (ECF subfamily)
MSTIPSEARMDGAWKAHRPHLVGVAFRMLGDIGEAEDIVQEAFTRLFRTTTADIEDVRGWLVVVTSRLCLDQIKSAHSRRERSSEESVLDAQAGAGTTLDPADRVTLDDSVRLALLVVLERLTAAERVVFVLHDIFEMPFDQIAETVGRTAPACRQLAKRARQKIDAAQGSEVAKGHAFEHRQVTEQFIEACATGSLEGLLAVLDPDVTGEIDIREDLLVLGAPQVARNFLTYWSSPGVSLVPLAAGAHHSILAFVDRELAGVFVMGIEGDRITDVHGILHPDKLDFLRHQLSLARA